MGVERYFGDWSIDQKVFGWILSNIPSDSHILELGSGWATGELARYYKMHSVEHSLEFINKYDSHYIFAPDNVNGWYSVETLRKELDKISYNLLLVDGPGDCEKIKFADHIDLFAKTIPIIIDDYNQPHIQNMADNLAKKLQKKLTVITGRVKTAAVLE